MDIGRHTNGGSRGIKEGGRIEEGDGM